MGNFYGKREEEPQQEFKEPKMAEENLNIPSDTKDKLKEKETKGQIEELEGSNINQEENPQPIIKVEEGENQNEDQNEEQNEEKQEEEPNDEQNEEEQQEEQYEEQPEDQNEEKYEEQNEEENGILKTPPKGRVINFTQNGNYYQVDEKGQIYKIILEQQESTLEQKNEEKPMNQVLQNDISRNKEINESYELNQEQNLNNIKYHDIVFRSNQKENESNEQKELQQENQRTKVHVYKIPKKKEPRDSNPKVLILSNKKKENKKYIINNKLNADFVEIPKNENNMIIENNEYTMVIGNGMDTGEYKFIGEKTLIKENISSNENFQINQEEIMEELNKRKNKKVEKKLKYEVIDKFYSLANVTGRTIKKIENSKIKTGQRNYFYASLNASAININVNSSLKGKNIQGNYPIFENMNIPLQYSALNMNFNNMNISMPSDNYSRYYLAQINKLRTEPQSFIGVIEDSKSNISKDRFGRIIYKGKIKVALNLGEAAFEEAINYLKEIRPMEPLIYKQIITVNAPMTEDEILDKNDLSKKVDLITNMGINIRSFWRDVIKDPEISFLLTIIDDNGIKSGFRRKDILSPYMKYIGISSSEINNNFACYITLA